MKSFIPYIPGILMLTLLLCACHKNASQDTKHQPAATQTFTTIDAAATQAKTDMLEALRMSPQLNPNTTPEQLEGAQALPAIRHFTVSFDRLLSADTSAALNNLSSPSGQSIIPYAGSGRVDATATVRQDENGFAITQLFNGEMTQDLSSLYQVTGDTPAEIRIYDVENLNARIFEVVKGDSTSYYTRYNNRFDLRRETRLSTLIPYLREEATDFRRKYGDLLRKEKLVD